MPLNDPSPTDPNVIVGVEAPGTEDSLREMAWAIAEELAITGYDEAYMWRVFENPFYGNAHKALQALGKQEVGEIISESARAFAALRGRK